jgi:protein-S-isoprenylcysteine O-methyltransferase Ste14
LFYTLFAAVSLGAIVLFQVNIASERVITPNLFLLITGSVVGASGILLMLICIKKYFLSLSGLKSLYQEAPSAELMIAGIHRYMRHPLYTGTFMAIWGAWLLFPTYSLMLTNIVITAYTLYAIRLEEIKLVAEFGEQYRAYQKTVPPLVPKLKLAGIFPANGR